MRLWMSTRMKRQCLWIRLRGQGRSRAVLATAQQFFLELEASVKRSRFLETLALVSDQECTEDQFQGLGSVYSLRTFLESWAQRQPA